MAGAIKPITRNFAWIRCSPTSAEELLQHLLGRYTDLAPLKQLLIQRTEGNPVLR